MDLMSNPLFAAALQSAVAAAINAGSASNVPSVIPSVNPEPTVVVKKEKGVPDNDVVGDEAFGIDMGDDVMIAMDSVAGESSASTGIGMETEVDMRDMSMEL
jgi:hypothetical protein